MLYFFLIHAALDVHVILHWACVCVCLSLSRTQQAMKVKKCVGFALKPLRCSDYHTHNLFMSLSQIPSLCDILFKADITNGQRRVVLWWSAFWWYLEEMWRVVDQDSLSECSFTQWTERTKAHWETPASHSPCLCTLLLCGRHPSSMAYTLKGLQWQVERKGEYQKS